jgi:DNA modification methylase/ParB-like chromosome segregation protein Spo0J
MNPQSQCKNVATARFPGLPGIPARRRTSKLSNPNYPGVIMAKTCPIEDIIISDDRQRKEFDPQKMDEMRMSIFGDGDSKPLGLLHAIVVREYLGEKILVAGETRMKVIQDGWALGGQLYYDGQLIPEGRIPYMNLGELTPIEAEEAELDENLRRKDLTWQEHAAAVARVQALRVKQAGKRRDDSIAEVRGRLAEAEDFDLPGQAALTDQLETLLATPVSVPIAVTAAELYPELTIDHARDLTRKETIVAQHLHKPEIAKAKSVDEAFKILKRQEEAKKNLELAASVGASFTADLHRVLNVNCLDWMGLPENSNQFDVILTDPPYGMGADSFGDAGGKLSGIEHHYDDSPEHFRELMSKWCSLAFQVAKHQAHAYVFCDIEHFTWLRETMRKAGWYVFRTPLINFKTNSGRVPLPDRGPRRQYEILLYAIKGDKPVTHIYPDVIQSQADENMSHGAQKPVAVYQNLLQRSVRAGDKILDSFGGSGTLIPAAHTFKCTATVLEMNPEYYGMCLKRIQDLQVVDALSEVLP